MVVNESSFSTVVKKKTSKKFTEIETDIADYYPHPTYIISSVSEYIDLISIISSSNSNLTLGDTVVYRGMSNEKYSLSPGLARHEYSFSDAEATLINEFLTRRPDAFSGLSDFDVLAKMQHYGLPTRLLDFTTNPLVALFFACESLFDKKGRVICNNTYLQNDSSAYVCAICRASVRKPLDTNYIVDEYLCDEQLPLNKYLRETYLYQETTVIRPKYWNQRIANQAGVFMIFPNEIIDRYRNILIKCADIGIDEAIKEYGRGNIDKADIEQALKIEPIDQYEKLPNSFLTEESYRQIVENYKKEKIDIDVVLMNRFQMKKEIKNIHKQKLANCFCSILVEGKNKKKILKELSYLGIGIDYIFPELEYTAKEIQRQIL